jgi:hypothetical protein
MTSSLFSGDLPYKNYNFKYESESTESRSHLTSFNIWCSCIEFLLWFFHQFNRNSIQQTNTKVGSETKIKTKIVKPRPFSKEKLNSSKTSAKTLEAFRRTKVDGQQQCHTDTSELRHVCSPC